MLDNLLKNTKGQATVVTPNRRLAIYLRDKFDLCQQQSNKNIWQSMDILPLTSWLERTWQKYHPAKILLNNHQARIIWQHIITASTKDKLLLNIPATAESAQQAYSLLQQWYVSYNHPLFASSEDTMTFQTWAQEFTNLCKNNNWLDRSNIADELMQYIKKNSAPLPNHLILAGFDQLAPQIEQLLNNLNCHIEYFDPNDHQPEQQIRLGLADQEQELINMALWAKKCGATNTNGNIGCIIPELTTIRPQVEHIFTKINHDNFDISIGQKLNNFPLIYAAFAKLTAKTSSKSLSPSKWVNFFIKQLQSQNWPGVQNLNHDEYQIMQRWQALLEEFATLDLVLNKISYHEALQYLQNLATNTIFQPLRNNAKIKILGALEAAGLNFDQLWIMGLTDKNWPPAPSPNPFIPIQLQKQLLLPHASAERELQFCRTLAARFSRSATNIIYSYPLQQQDQPLKPSSLIKHIKEITCHDLDLPKFIPFLIQHIPSPPIETIIDEQAPPIMPTEKIHGGSKIFKLQAACPFRAFAECRLGAKELESPQIGLNPRERGVLIHTILEKIWQIIGNHQQLCSYSETALTNIIQQAITYGLQEINQPSSQFAKLEMQRLGKLLYEWLTLEKTRCPFTVLSQEQSFTTNIGSLKNISIRADRIDQLDDGSLLILDYKTTNKTSPKSWDGNRPDEPQLPLYCVTYKQPINGLIFAQIKKGEVKFTGITQQDDQISKVPSAPDWSDLIQQWQIILGNLSEDFCAGNAKIDPKNNNTCKNCKLQSLCRVKCEDL